MIYKAINALVFGLAMVLMIDFILFIGFKLHYFDFYEIKEYFNVYFFDNQSFLVILTSSLILGYLMLYSPFPKFFQSIYLAVLLGSLTIFYHPIGHKVAQEFFTKEDLSFTIGKQNFKATLLYEGRDKIYIKRDEIERVIVIKKEDLK
ncbi:MAG: hypothetical protein RBS42_07400 [Campylobacterales bacterium]|nr:hypothetical protein [Campylobacterales bacterium]